MSDPDRVFVEVAVASPYTKEAQLFAYNLQRLFLRVADKRHYHLHVIYDDNDENGLFLSSTWLLYGSDSFADLSGYTGSYTDTKTESKATIVCYPYVNDADMLPEKDVELYSIRPAYGAAIAGWPEPPRYQAFAKDIMVCYQYFPTTAITGFEGPKTFVRRMLSGRVLVDPAKVNETRKESEITP